MKEKLRKISIVLLALAFAASIFSFFVPRIGKLDGRVASSLERRLSLRLEILDQNVSKAFSQNPDEWMSLPHLPEDMVIYRYVNGKLQSWAGRFPVINDQIYYASLSSRRDAFPAPLAGIGPYYSYKRLSSNQSFLLKRQVRDSVTIIAGLNLNAAHGHILPAGYVVRGVQSPDGITVKVDGRDVFKLVNDSIPEQSSIPPILFFAAFLLLSIALLLFLISTPKLRYASIAIIAVLISLLALGKVSLFSSGDMSNIAVIFRINFFLLYTGTCLFICRRNLWSKLKTKAWIAVSAIADVLVILAVFVLCGIEIYKVSVYTHINLDLTKLEIVGVETVGVLVSLICLLTSAYLFFVLLQPLISRLNKKRVSLLSLSIRTISAIVLAAFLLLVGRMISFEREESIVASWAERLANDRDNSVETILKSVERGIITDEIVSRLSASSDNAAQLREYLLDNYLFRVLANYDVRVSIGGDSDALGLESGVPIAANSRFLYTPLPDQRSRYVGVFQYFDKDKGFNSVYISIDPKISDRSSSISYLLGVGREREEIPYIYSYAKYKGRDRLYFNGSYMYPTKLTRESRSYFHRLEESHYTEGGYLHFVTKVSDDELIVISRKNIAWDRYLLAFSVFALLFFGVESLYSLHRRKKVFKSRNSVKKTITLLIIVCLTLAMAVLVTISVTFVFNRNEANARAMMSDKTNSIRSLLQSGLRPYSSSSDFTLTPEIVDIVHRVSTNTGSDISLFDASGKILFTTSPELIVRRMVGSRMDGNAFMHIMFRNDGYYIGREEYVNRKIYTMYAPILGSDGKIMTIFASPYTQRNYDFKFDAITHTISIAVVYIVLLIISLLLVSYFVDKAFKPLLEMSRKMEAGDVDRLEYIDYDRQDEISVLVKSYNRMVTDLTNSNKVLAQAERDKAWSEMARSVAHEIKNPLTPMRLQIQRIQRLKAIGDPSWQDKFDDMSKVLLDQIDILSDTATQFSDFAKLYSEEPVELDLDLLLKEQVELYDNRPDIRFDYLGLPNAIIHGPKPQLVRVFVNMLSNAVQACEGREGSIISVSLRNGSDSKYYEIAFEDNGPGVAEENLSKLFTPKFTTKSSGSGLGLSISRSILERCHASIAYSRSFALGGACFTIRYPKG